MANGYFLFVIALFVLYSLLHHKKMSFYEDDINISQNLNSCGLEGVNFVSKKEENDIYRCFSNSTIPCDEKSKYRLISGYCNNLQNPLWGGSNTCFGRLADSYYDGVYGLRKGINGGKLPISRKLSTTVLSYDKILSEDKTMLLTSFTQIIVHDAGTAIGKSDFLSKDCCKIEEGTREHKIACCELEIPHDDEFYSKFNITCIDLHRHSNTFTESGCVFLKQPYPLTRVSSHLDLSFLYGFDLESSTPYKEYSGGRLLTSNYTDDGPTLPLVDGGCSALDKISAVPICFASGDGRINQNPEVVIFTTIFLRSHNYIAGELEKLHPDWDDEKLFEESRRINVAAYQRVIYNEFLPALIGKENCEKRGFLEEKEGYSDQYDPDVNTQSLVCSFTGALRAIHTLQLGNVTLRDNQYRPSGYYRLADHFNDQSFFITEPHMFTQIINGFSKNKAIEKLGQHAAFDLWNVCFKDTESHFMFDLFAADIERGRDFGIPPYNAMRKHCGLCPLTSFDQLGDGNHADIAEKLEQLYDSIEDVDLIIGVYLETPIPNSIFGPTGQCLVEESFSRYKKGDRFFYEFDNEYVLFTEEQLKSIKQVTFSSFICIAQNNSELEMQEDAFHQPSPTNSMKKCGEIPFVDFTLF